MEKKKWLWKRKSSERSPGESESSGSFSSPSERYSDEQDASRESPNGSVQSPEITSKLSFTDDEVKENMKRLTEKLSAALVNVSAKEELVKQHAKVAEEAVAGWEKAENEVSALKQQLEIALQQNVNLEVRVSHLDGALKECVRQLRQGRDEQEKRISDAIAEGNREWESRKVELEKQIVHLQARTEAKESENSSVNNPKSLLVLESVEKENLFLKQEMKARCKELESVIIERDLSIQAAETASKLQLESIKKVAKLEAECRRLQSLARKSSPVNNLKLAPTSHFYAESLTDSHSDSGERLNAVEMDACRTCNVDRNGSEPSCSDSWASALIAELDQFKNEKLLASSLTACSIEFDMMDDFLEMERLAALPDTKSNTPFTASESTSGESVSMVNPLRAELDSMTQRVAELEKKLEQMEAEKAELEAALDESQGLVKAAETKTDELQKELKAVNEAKELLESQLIGMEVEARTMSANVDLLNTEIQSERTLSAELSVKCRELETVSVLQKNTPPNSNGELKIKQEDLAVAADKLAECQKTIASLGMQLKSLATLEDFLIDTTNIPGFSNGTLSGADMPKDETSHSTRTGDGPGGNVGNGSSEEAPAPFALLTNHLTAAKSRNGFGKFFSRSKSGVELVNRQD
ncbi:filament-like plant protein [Salvia miltiorrhiza]|uniref:filament-like plant protein n=1 Tax=Salvia miltiorrhiza TaxID=226208 RepID=UPI0025ACFAEA|nr:filament-like plant protein [Salvia miltiorrhiza]XP_057795747.1 filament-like plant protein [Salvia miltiorrhiza]XP_057795748.1 filament-like plant protein [Salvia miltiorrhiza]